MCARNSIFSNFITETFCRQLTKHTKTDPHRKMLCEHTRSLQECGPAAKRTQQAESKDHYGMLQVFEVIK